MGAPRGCFLKIWCEVLYFQIIMIKSI